MRAPLWLCLLPLLLTAGCTPPLLLDSGDPEIRSAINDRAAQHQATVLLRDGRRFQADLLYLSPDSTWWVEPESKAIVTVRSDEVLSVAFPNTHRRGGEGLALGLVSGVVLGYAVGAQSYDGPNILSQSQAESALGGAMLFAGLGGVIGFIAGHSTRAVDVFKVDEGTN